MSDDRRNTDSKRAGVTKRKRTEGLTPSERSLRARMAAHASWANTSDRRARTAAGRKAAIDRFERQVDPPATASRGRAVRLSSRTR